MSVCFVIAFSMLAGIICAQDTTTFMIKDLVETKKFNCKNATSMDVCKTNIYNTDQPPLLYKINFDKDGRTHSQGPVVKEEINEEGRKKPTIEYFETGTWQYYNYEKNEIVYFECVYSNTPGCRMVKKEELKRERIY